LQLQRGVVGQGSEGPGRAQFLGRDLVPVHLRLAVLRGEMEPPGGSGPAQDSRAGAHAGALERPAGLATRPVERSGVGW
jgi:hypothetical protein